MNYINLHVNKRHDLSVNFPDTQSEILIVLNTWYYTILHLLVHLTSNWFFVDCNYMPDSPKHKKNGFFLYAIS